MSVRPEVLAALRAAGDTGVSGEALARKLRVSRAAVGKHVAALRELGYEIEAAAGAGYRLVSAPDLALPDEVAPLVRDPLWVRFEGGPETTSTNDDAKALARTGAPEGTVVVAARQRSGRGRLGREWVSPVGGAYISVVLRPDLTPSELAPLPLVIALGVARGLATLGIDALLKWPNDVWLQASAAEPTAMAAVAGSHARAAAASGKVAGILLEMQAESDRVEWVVAGVGLNVRRVDEGVEGAAYAGERCAPLSTARAAAVVLDGVALAYREFTDSGFAGLLAEYQKRSMLDGREVTVRDAGGRARESGRVLGIDEAGYLRLETPTGQRRVASGDVTLRGPRAPQEGV